MPRLPVVRGCALALVVLLSACSGTPGGQSSGRISIVTSISTFNSFAQAVGGSRVDVTSLVPVGASPETYEPTPQNVATLARAQILVENGAGLESWLDRTVKNAGSKSLRIVVCTNGLPVKNDNPHLWMDPQYAKTYVRAIRDGLIMTDPAHADEYRKNAARYSAKLDTLTKTIARRIGRIPAQRRYMIVFHNAWQYYNDRFGITTLGFVERNPGQDPNPQQLGTLIDLAKAHHLRAVFSEPEYSPKLAQQIAHEAGITIVDNLYDDSVGTDPRVADYIGMLTYDTDVIVRALQ
ncbi:MAG TPA: metal ABC transporter substrate-binding protein [Candidatus Baltobacteraceae bacterium]|nr:metal ABC transporter substrate-binding protein [Candidatus Baltobacteraceae bacterium]